MQRHSTVLRSPWNESTRVAFPRGAPRRAVSAEKRRLLHEDQLPFLAVRDVSGKDDNGKQEPLHIDENVALAVDELLTFIKPTYPAHKRLDRLAANNRGARRGIAADMQLYQFTPPRIDARPRYTEPPLMEIQIHRFPQAVLAWQVLLDAAAA